MAKLTPYIFAFFGFLSSILTSTTDSTNAMKSAAGPANNTPRIPKRSGRNSIRGIRKKPPHQRRQGPSHCFSYRSKEAGREQLECPSYRKPALPRTCESARAILLLLETLRSPGPGRPWTVLGLCCLCRCGGAHGKTRKRALGSSQIAYLNAPILFCFWETIPLPC